MHGPTDWAAALAARPRASARILFARFGVVARCDALTSSELAECYEMGGERGARYAVYLSCQSIREAGEALRKRGQLASAFDITERIAYSDAMAAAGIIARLSGGAQAEIRLLDDNENEADAISRGMNGEVGAAPASSPFVQQTGTDSSPVGALFADDEALADFIPGVFAKSEADGDDTGFPSPDVAADDANLQIIDYEKVDYTVPERGATLLPAEEVLRETDTAFPTQFGGTYGEIAGGGGFTAYVSAARHDALQSVEPTFTGLERGMAGSDTDGFARILADRLRDAAGNI